jgi:hypothetical protein
MVLWNTLWDIGITDTKNYKKTLKKHYNNNKIKLFFLCITFDLWCICMTDSTIRMLTQSQRTVYVVRANDLKSRVSVRYQTQAGSALPGVDYEPINDTLLIFDIGERSRDIYLTTINDGKPVPDLVFYVILYDAQGNLIYYLFIYLLKLSKRATIRSTIQLHKGAASQANKGHVNATYMEPIK